MNNLLAQNPTPIGQICGKGLGPFFKKCQISPNSPESINFISLIISAIVGILTIAAGIYFMFQFIIGGYNWIASAGDKQKLQTAQDRITYALLGLIVVAAAYAIVGIVGFVLGLDIFLENPGALLNQILGQ